MIGYYNYSVILTYLGLGTGVVGITSALNGNIRLSIICLLLCGFCDMFDGTVARRCKRGDEAKCFGMQIDSLSDLVCFGVFPAMIGYVLGAANIFTLVCMIVYILAALIRLGYFNVQEIMREPEDGKRTHYTGLPVTSAALIMPAIAMIGAVRFAAWPYVYPFALLLMSFAFICRVKIRKPYGAALAVFAVLGALILVLSIIYGGNIPCSRSFTAIG
ncbi:MAG: CDP-alcohol phosphatidyltransferase family protein [Clostridia bacterium]|nr:CDP-alcohol phosphatidyltransferase family protein [Clostridia bacterium]